MKVIGKIFLSLVVLSMMLGLIGPITSGFNLSAEGRLHPQVFQIASVTPNQNIALIVQKTDLSSRAEELVYRLGGEVTKDLSIINAFVAEMPASQALHLAASPYVRWVSLDAPVESTARKDKSDGKALKPNYFLDTLGVKKVWDMGLRGEGIGVAVIDSGIFSDRDFTVTTTKPHTRLKVQISFSDSSPKADDVAGHGTHIAGILGGNGRASDGVYAGIAPKVDLINLKISDENGMAYESEVVAAMQWVFENKDSYNIRVVNLSINSSVEQSYHTSPMDAAAEILWFNGVVVVASAGNKTGGGGFNTVNAAPANDPFIITVGASDEMETSDRSDDVIAAYSARGNTVDGFSKPDLIAPGTDIISVLSDSSDWDEAYPNRVELDGEYFRLSGTSMSAPMVTGAVALLLQDEPNLTPDQVKFRLMNSGTKIGGGSYTYLDVYAAVTGTTTESSNTGQEVSQLLWSGDEPVEWDSVTWDSVAWNSVAWNSVAWNSVAWNSVAWNSVAWNE